jgi:hypothetical protein
MIFEAPTQIERTRELLAAARRRARDLSPYSPAWDAAMADVDDLEEQLWRLSPPVLKAPRHELTVGR